MPPTKLAHVVFQTNRLKEMSDWYCSVLSGHIVYQNPHLCFVTYDEEHHRVAFVDFGPLTPRDPAAGGELMVKATDQPGLIHVRIDGGVPRQLRPPQGPRRPSVLLRQPRAHDLDVLS